MYDTYYPQNAEYTWKKASNAVYSKLYINFGRPNFLGLGEETITISVCSWFMYKLFVPPLNGTFWYAIHTNCKTSNAMHTAVS